ncbi:MAG: HD domain-containing protein, partial [Thermoproteus sp.]|nr:HD domain-containing protein [Thermoproteus sp.]
MEFVKQIRDPIHGWIRLTREESELLDEIPAIQRLRYIKQLGFVYLVYPTATYSRFDHSLGVMHLAYLVGKELLNKSMSSSAEEAEDLLRHLRVAALLHDIGHYPFSHTFEEVIGELVATAGDWGCGVDVDLAAFERAKPHEVTTRLIVERISPSLKDKGYDPSLVKALLFKAPELAPKFAEEVKMLSTIISGTLDADRLDYIMRDIYFTGAAVGTAIGYVDIERIINSMNYVGGLGIVFDEKARVHLEGYIITRYNLYRHVYLHHKTM